MSEMLDPLDMVSATDGVVGVVQWTGRRWRRVLRLAGLDAPEPPDPSQR